MAEMTVPRRPATVVNLAEHRAEMNRRIRAGAEAPALSFRLGVVRIGPNHEQIEHRRRMLRHLTTRL